MTERNESKPVACLEPAVPAEAAAQPSSAEGNGAGAPPSLGWLADRAGRRTWFGRGWFDFTGQVPDATQAEGWLDLVHPDDRERSRQLFRDAVTRLAPFEADVRLRRADGGWRWVRDRGEPVTGPDGAFVGWAGSAVEIPGLGERHREWAILAEANRELVAEREILWASLDAPDFDDAIDRVLPRIAAIAGFEIAAIEILDAARRAMTIHLVDRGAARHVSQVPLDKTLSGQVVASGRVFSTAEGPLPEGVDDRLRELGVRSFLAIPLVARDRLIGTLSVADRARPVPPDLEHRLGRIAPHVASLLVRKRAEDDLRHSEGLFRDLVENLRDVFWISSPDFLELEYVSPSWETLYGLPLDELREHPTRWFENVLPEDQERLGEILLSGPGDAREYEYRIRRPDGTIRRVRDRFFAVRDPDGSVRHLAGITSDITEEKQAIAANLRLAAAVRNAAEAIVVTDRDGRIEAVNPAFERISGWSAAEAAGQSTSILKSGRHDAAFYRKMWETLLSGETWKGEIVNRRKDGTLYDEEATISPIRDTGGEVSGFVAVKRDVTEEKRLRAESRRAQELDLFGRLVAGVAHEVRNPLHSMHALVATLELDMQGNAEEEPIVAAVRLQLDRLSRLMLDLLEISRPASRWKIEPIRPLEVCREVARLWKESNARLPLEVVASGDETVEIRADRARLVQALLNLVDNSSQHSAGGTRIEIEVSSDGEEAILAVVDQGTGIPDGQLDEVVHPFFTTRKGGTGLGLPLVRHVAEGHGGSFSIRNNAGRGCRAEIRIPLPRSTQP